jgi:Hypothetical glycosyl hydrolase family 15
MMERMARWRRTVRSSGSLAALIVFLASCTGSPPSAPPSFSPPASAGSALWAARYATGGLVSEGRAVAQAERFDVIGALPWTYRNDVAAMKAANPGLILLAYMNATFAQRHEGHRYPAAWYLRDANGNRVRSRNFGNYLMDPTDPAWIHDRVETCGRFLRVSHYDGCILDMLGTAPVNAGYVTAAPIDPSTGQPWTADAWLQATSALGTAVKRGNAQALVVGNGLQDGTRFFDQTAPSSAILEGIDGGIAETWLRNAAQPLDRYPNVAAWQRSIDMLHATDADVFVMTKTWTAGTPEEKEAWHRFAYASFLLGYAGHAYFTYSSALVASVASDRLADTTAIGAPVESYERVGRVFERRFTGGLVVVNPGATSTTTRLDGTLRGADGQPIRSIDLGPHGAAILTAA